MKKYILLFALLSLIATLFFTLNEETYEGFVTIENDKFILNNKEFNPIVLNYVTSLQKDSNTIWASAYNGYNPDSKIFYKSKKEAQQQLLANLNLIKDLGFNTVRITSIGEANIDKKNDVLSFNTYTNNNKVEALVLSNDSIIETYLNTIEELLTLVEKAELKPIEQLEKKWMHWLPNTEKKYCYSNKQQLIL